MKPKEKAEALVEQMYCQTLLSTVNTPRYLAIECAIVAVEEITEEARMYCDDNHVMDRLFFWGNVQFELENMR